MMATRWVFFFGPLEGYIGRSTISGQIIRLAELETGRFDRR